ncbi:MAG: hypothetical protein KDC98_06600 [Planctomycetes bacterium]|nr:hypothetical protein [Planctomycetota bacterium]
MSEEQVAAAVEDGDEAIGVGAAREATDVADLAVGKLLVEALAADRDPGVGGIEEAGIGGVGFRPYRDAAEVRAAECVWKPVPDLPKMNFWMGGTTPATWSMPTWRLPAVLRL